MIPSRSDSRIRSRGISLVETALAIPLLLLLVFGTVDLGRILFGHLTLQHAVREAGRFAVTGNTTTGTGGRHPRLDSVIQKAVFWAQPFPLTAADVQVSSRMGGAGSVGGPGDLVTISIHYPIHFLTPLIGKFFRNERYVVDVSTTFRNEFFPQTRWQ
jgi:hypothetical protein